LQLRAAGLLSSVRGNQGGYLLAVKPEDLTVLRVVEVLEGDFLSRLDDDSAVGQGARATQEIWRRLGQSMREVLGSVTLADLVALPDPEPVRDFAI
jgi:Rrf2 family protein